MVDNWPIRKWPWLTIPRDCLQVVKALLMSGASMWRVDSRGWTLGAPGLAFPCSTGFGTWNGGKTMEGKNNVDYELLFCLWELFFRGTFFAFTLQNIWVCVYIHTCIYIYYMYVDMTYCSDLTTTSLDMMICTFVRERILFFRLIWGLWIYIIYSVYVICLARKYGHSMIPSANDMEFTVYKMGF